MADYSLNIFSLVSFDILSWSIGSGHSVGSDQNSLCTLVVFFMFIALRWWAITLSWSVCSVGTPAPLIANAVKDPNSIFAVCLPFRISLEIMWSMSEGVVISWPLIFAIIVPHRRRFHDLIY